MAKLPHSCHGRYVCLICFASNVSSCLSFAGFFSSVGSFPHQLKWAITKASRCALTESWSLARECHGSSAIPVIEPLADELWDFDGRWVCFCHGDKTEAWEMWSAWSRGPDFEVFLAINLIHDPSFSKENCTSFSLWCSPFSVGREVSCHFCVVHVAQRVSSSKISLSIIFAQEVLLVLLHGVANGALFDGMCATAQRFLALNVCSVPDGDDFLDVLIGDRVDTRQRNHWAFGSTRSFSSARPPCPQRSTRRGETFCTPCTCCSVFCAKEWRARSELHETSSNVRPMRSQQSCCDGTRLGRDDEVQDAVITFFREWLSCVANVAYIGRSVLVIRACVENASGANWANRCVAHCANHWFW